MDQNSSIDSAICTTKSQSQKPMSMSSFSVESGAGEASTSGCSSLVDANRQKTLKKQRVRQCLEELRSLVKPPRGRGKGGGTLVTLQNVITQMKKYRDVGDSTANTTESLDPELLGSAQDGDGIDWPLASDSRMEHGEWFKIVMSTKESNVLQVPHELLRMLRYPNNYWFNQSLMDYIYKRDMVTVNTHLGKARIQPKQPVTTNERESPSTSEQKNIFFFRIRHYKSIRHGFSLNRSEKYTVFCGQASRQKVQLNFPPGTPVEGLQADQVYPVLECTPLKSAYICPGVLPTQRTFLMRHTVHCNYIFLHPSSIPLTGYIPQEFIGTSIFDYYHPQDLLILLGIYQQIVASPGKTIRSVPYRMRVKNGDYIRLETEWSSFVNPWTNRIDFIICKHHVVGGPTNLDVLKECPSSKRQAVELSAQARSLQRHIRTVLQQRVFRRSTRHLRRTVQPKQVETELPMKAPVTVCRPLSRRPLAEEKPEVSPDVKPAETSKEEEPSEGTERPDTAKLSFLENEKLLIYEQLNYAQNIRRFLLSCWASQQGKSSSEATESDVSDPEELTVDLSLPKPPSFASSTKALVSEREQLEELMPPSPTHEDVPDDANTKTHADDDIYQPILLTEEIISLHNRQQRQQYIEKMVLEKTTMVSGQGLRIVKESGKARKRTRQKELEESPTNTKVSRKEESLGPQWSQTDPSQLLYPPVVAQEETSNTSAVCHPPAPASTPVLGGSFPGLQCSQPLAVMTMSPASFVTVSNISQVRNGLMFCPASSHSNPQLVTLQAMDDTSVSQAQQVLRQNRPGADVNVPATQWPYYEPRNYQQSGLSYMPQIVYKPVPGSYFPPISAQPVIRQQIKMQSPPSAAAGAPSKSDSPTSEEYSLDSGESPTKSENWKSKEKKSIEGSDSQSAEETSSSMLYLLDSNNSDPSESDDQQKKSLIIPHMNTAPPWRANVHWGKDVEMCFKMPSVNIQEVLKSDKLFLQKMRQTSQVQEQVQELFASMQSSDCVLMDDDGILSSAPKSTNPSEQCTETKMDLDTEGHMDSGEAPGTASPASETDSGEKHEKTGSDSDLSDGAVSKDSGELTSSVLTPSDQRSHDDVPSSAKESDMTSSDNGQSPVPKESEKRPKMVPSWKKMMGEVFVPLNVQRVTKLLTKPVPPWLENTTFDNEVQMQYNKAQFSDVGKVLAMDEAQLKSMDQPKLVLTQLDELMVQLKSQIMQALTPLNPSSDLETPEQAEGLANWSAIIQSSSGSNSSEGKVFPYSCGEPEELAEDMAVCEELGEGAGNSTREVLSAMDTKGGFSSPQPSTSTYSHDAQIFSSRSPDMITSRVPAGDGEAPSDSGKDSAVEVSSGRDTAYVSESCSDSGSRELSEGAECAPESLPHSQSDKNMDTTTTAATTTNRIELKETQSNSSESVEIHSLLDSCSLSPHTGNCSTPSHETANSVCSELSSHSVHSTHSCCSVKQMIAEIEEEKAEASPSDGEEDGQKEQAVSIMKTLFTTDEDLLAIPE